MAVLVFASLLGLSLLISQLAWKWKLLALAAVAVVVAGWFLNGTLSYSLIASYVAGGLVAIWAIVYWTMVRRGVAY